VADSRILVAVSTPWASDKLFNTIYNLANRLNASVVVAHVARPTEQDESAEETRMRGEQTIATLTDRLMEANIPADRLLLYGDDTAMAILNAAEDREASLIVIGLSGKGRLTRLLAGDIPLQVVKKSGVPMLVLPPDWSGTI
jgi:nucleotide-binding universal stress UspA family protein